MKYEVQARVRKSEGYDEKETCIIWGSWSSWSSDYIGDGYVCFSEEEADEIINHIIENFKTDETQEEWEYKYIEV